MVCKREEIKEKIKTFVHRVVSWFFMQYIYGEWLDLKTLDYSFNDLKLLVHFGIICRPTYKLVLTRLIILVHRVLSTYKIEIHFNSYRYAHQSFNQILLYKVLLDAFCRHEIKLTWKSKSLWLTLVTLLQGCSAPHLCAYICIIHRSTQFYGQKIWRIYCSDKKLITLQTEYECEVWILNCLQMVFWKNVRFQSTASDHSIWITWFIHSTWIL